MQCSYYEALLLYYCGELESLFPFLLRDSLSVSAPFSGEVFQSVSLAHSVCGVLLYCPSMCTCPAQRASSSVTGLLRARSFFPFCYFETINPY